MQKQTFSSDADMTVGQRISNAKDVLVCDTKDSVQMGLEVAAGSAALAILRSFVVPAKMSIADRLFGKGAVIKKVIDSAIGSFVLAATAHVAVTVFAPKNERLHKIVKLALNASIVELTARIDIQSYTDKLANKLFNNTAIANLFAGETKKD